MRERALGFAALLLTGILMTPLTEVQAQLKDLGAPKPPPSTAILNNARPIDLPRGSAPVAPRSVETMATPGPAPLLIPGGTGELANRVRAVTIPAPRATDSGDGRAPENYGSGNQGTVYHYTDNLVDTELMNDYPYTTTGWFYFQKYDGTYSRCTASLISRSILVTAGHCVHSGPARVGGGGSAYYIRAGWFYPAYAGGTNAAYGYAPASSVLATTQWVNTGGIDRGYDVALVVLHKRAGTSNEMGAYTGWLGFCGSNCLQRTWHLSQLGYPGNYYGGNYMTQGEHIEVSNGRDYLLGSGMQGGSSGGPHIANMGALSDSTSNQGQWPWRNYVFAVTSWGYTSDIYKIQGASSLTGAGADGNGFRAMYNTMCLRARTLHGAGSCATY